MRLLEPLVRLGRRWGRPLTLRQEILGSILAVLVPSTVFMFYWYPARQETLALSNAHDRARETAELAGAALGQSMGNGDSLGIRGMIEWLSHEPTLVYAMVTDPSGRLVIGYDPLHLRPRLEPAIGATSVVLDAAWLRAVAPARYHDRTVGSVQLGFSAEVVEEISNDRLVTGIVGVSLLVLGILASLYFAARVGAPIVALRHATDAIAQGNYAPVLPTGGNVETRALSRAFATMAGEVRDATSRLEAARDAALAGERAKADFLAAMSHEIRTPLNGVTGMLGLLLDTQLDRSQAEYAETARRSAEALLAVINDILDFSKIEAGRLELELIDFDLRHTLEDVVSLLASMAQAKGLEVGVLTHEAVPRRLRGDPGRLRQVLFNLVGNAIKFTEHGEVVVHVRVEEAAPDGARLRFEVTDTGIGIAPDALARLFQPFAQADASTTRRFGGTGLGLVICQRLVAVMDGEIGVTSTPGSGSTFWFTARFGTARSQAEELPAADDALRALRILAVDDSVTALAHLEDQLLEWGIATATVTDAEHALLLLRAAADAGKPYQLALIDYQMPGLDGLELGRRIKADPAIASTRLVLLTAVGARGQARAAESVGFAAFLTKPLRQSALHDCLALLAGDGTHSASGAPLITRHTLAEGRSASRARILVAEDNAVNQRVILGILERLGYRADVVGTGAEAVEAVARSPYDLVLLDVQMPVMDGFEAAARIRRAEAGNGRLPLVALTADASAADRDRCRHAGMDDHVAKPIDRAQLRETLQRWLPQSLHAGAESPAGSPPEQSDPAVFDRRQLGELVGDDLQALHRYLDLYLSATTDLLRQAATAVADRDPTAVRHVAHSLRGSSGNVGALEVARVAAELQGTDCVTDWPATEAACRELHLAFERMAAHVRKIA
jgi:signal transduction histidine kinase/CheY-like chemotaxis protein/HPt (histidine-containing phosphotransfer) domain-containing protein